MLTLLAAVPVDDQFWFGLLVGAGLVCVPLVRAWSADRKRCGDIIRAHRSELTNLRTQLVRTNERCARLAEELETLKRSKPAGGSPGTGAGGAGLQP